MLPNVPYLFEDPVQDPTLHVLFITLLSLLKLKLLYTYTFTFIKYEMYVKHQDKQLFWYRSSQMLEHKNT